MRHVRGPVAIRDETAEQTRRALRYEDPARNTDVSMDNGNLERVFACEMQAAGMLL